MQDQPSQPEAGGAAAAATLMDFGPANENNTTNQSFGPALVSTASLDSPARESSILNIATDNNNQKPFQGQDGDSRATLREAEEYADGLARELIDDGRGAAAASVVAAAPLYFEEDSLNASPQRIHESPSPQGKETEEQQQQHQQQEDEDEEREGQAQNKPEKEEHQDSEGEGDKENVAFKLESQIINSESITEDILESSNENNDTNTKDSTEELNQNRYEEEDQHDLADESSLIKLQDTTNLLHQTFKTAANTSQISNDDKTSIMEFTKNYSDDLLMGQRASVTDQAGGPDLADFELPPHSGSSSSGSEQAATKQQSPTKQRKSSSSSITQASSSQAAVSSVAPPDLAAVKNLLMSSYSRVSHIFHWKSPIETGVLFAVGMTLIIALTFFSIISVVAYSALGVILASGLIRIYKTSMKALNRSPETPFDRVWDRILSLNVTMSPEKMHELVDASHENLNASLVYFKQVLLVEDKLATFKFGFFLYILTYIGSWFNGLTLIKITYLSLFLVPVIYEKNKAKIDECLNLATNQVSSAISMVTNKVSTLTFGPSSAGSRSAKKQE